jgi:hypothetical protein
MLYLVRDGCDTLWAIQGPECDFGQMLSDWVLKKIGKLEEWPGRPSTWNGPWPNFNNAQTESYYFRRQQWWEKYHSLDFTEFFNELDATYQALPFKEIEI